MFRSRERSGRGWGRPGPGAEGPIAGAERPGAEGRIAGGAAGSRHGGALRAGAGGPAPYDRAGASPRRFASMSASWSSTQSPGSRAVTIRFRPCALHERSSADMLSAR